MLLAIMTDALQIVVFPLFVAGALSPADDILDFGIAAVLVHLLGWHWEFLPRNFLSRTPSTHLRALGSERRPSRRSPGAKEQPKNKLVAMRLRVTRENHRGAPIFQAWAKFVEGARDVHRLSASRPAD
jgi:hypothetical protein